MPEKLQGTAAEMAQALEARYESLKGASARRTNRSLFNLTALSFVLVGSLMAYSYRTESAQKLGIGVVLALAGLGLAGWTWRHLSVDPLDPPQRLPDLAQLLRLTEQLSGLPVHLEIDLSRPDRLRGTYRDTPWNAALEWEFLDTFTHDRTESYQQLTPLEQRERLSGDASSVNLQGRPWQERGVRVKVHTKRLLLRLELDGRHDVLEGCPTAHLKPLKFSQSESGSTFLWEFPKNHSEKEGLGHEGRPNLGVSRINRHHPEFVGEQVGCAIAWLLEKTR